MAKKLVRLNDFTIFGHIYKNINPNTTILTNIQNSHADVFEYCKNNNIMIYDAVFEDFDQPLNDLLSSSVLFLNLGYMYDLPIEKIHYHRI